MKKKTRDEEILLMDELSKKFGKIIIKRMGFKMNKPKFSDRIKINTKYYVLKFLWRLRKQINWKG